MTTERTATLDPADTSDREIVITRVLAAPRELVFDAFTDDRHIGQWWGPNGFTTTTYEKDVRPGGSWRFTMHGPDGTDYPNYVAYREVVRPERLAYAHGTAPGEPAKFDVTVTFEDAGEGKTKVTLHSVFPTPEARDFVVREHGAIEGGRQTLQRLDEHLAAMRSAAPAASGT
jgi:uncharacterized protein YndB with AHSA1/START domain